MNVETALDANRPASLALNLVLEAELPTLVSALESEGIDVVVLKGVPLALRLFGTIASRSMIDNDLLVRRQDAIRAARVLAAAGYRSIDCRRIENQLACDYQYRLVRPLPGGGGLCAELHWSPFSQLLYPAPEEVIWRHVEPFHWNGRMTQVFDRPLTLVHLAAHFVQSDFAIPQILRDVAVAWNLWYAQSSADDALDLARQTDLIHALDFALRCAADLGWLKTPPPAIGSARASRLRRLLPADRLWTPRPVPDYERWLLALLLVDPRRVPRWLRYAMFPPLENLAAIEGAEMSPGLRWRHLVRPFRALARALGGRERIRRR
jgi:hypothetical protein